MEPAHTASPDSPNEMRQHPEHPESEIGAVFIEKIPSTSRRIVPWHSHAAAVTDSTITSPFDGLKLFGLSSGLVLRLCSLGSFIAGNASGRVARMLRPVSQSAGVSTRTHIQTIDAVRLYGEEAIWKDVAQRLLDDTRQQRTGRHEEDGCWPGFETT